MEKVAFTLRGKTREREFSSSEAVQEFIRLAAEKFGDDFVAAPSPEALASCIEAVESGKGKDGSERTMRIDKA
jgi:hypothetical protein